VPPNILPLFYQLLIIFVSKIINILNTGNVLCGSQVSKPSNLIQKQKFLDVIFKIFLVFCVPQNFF
jgi:hypothetical protein